MTFTKFKEEVAKAFGVPVQFQRYWLWAERKNHTYRPYRTLTAQEEIQPVGQLREVSNKENNAELKLFLEVELCLDLRPFPPQEKIKEDVLLFFKLYDPLIEKIRYVGRLFVKESDKPLDVLTKINELAGFSADEEIELFEEIKFEPHVVCEYIDSNMSFRECVIGDGDIICFQKSIRNQCSEQYRFPEVPSYLDYVLNRQIRLRKEQEEKEQKRKEGEEARLYTIIKVARDEDLGEQIGKEIYFDLVDHDKVRAFRILKQMPFTQFKEEVARTFGIPVKFQRYWLWEKRENSTYRPYRALTAQEEIQSVGELRDVSNKGNSAEIKLFLEVELCLDLRPLSPPGKVKEEEILIFFKLYDPLKENIRYIGRLSVKGSGKLQDILSKLKEFAGVSPNEEIELYKEINFEPSVMCEKIDNMLSFSECQLEDGDIICFQKSLQNQCIEQYRFPEVPSFLEYVHNHQQKEHKMLASGSDFPTKRPEPHEVTPTDTASTVAPQDVDDAESTRFTWTVDNFSTLNVKLYSDVFSVGGCKWRILMFPKGNNTNHLSIYLDAADAASLPSGWSSCAEFSLAVLDQVHGEFTVRQDTKHKFTKHTFNASVDDWGFTSFLPLNELHDPGRGYLVDDKVILEAVVSMPKSH
ncbi:Ubiquitin carboxyl-terminal hydrolase 13 [Capsicum baccatum]|uniref:Ubiquitin carboxyl-terminal hydrolase 13 n=1 Tax=Capsicum baccatum TaxID=33114 RepID=A0A2G2X297_CAPBA|nr:Ubiquitin carboxyl-terminal hydrolase 13 [Capsicum baccatum]